MNAPPTGTELYRSLEGLLPLVTRPGRYIGHELNLARKDPERAALRMVISYPDVYEVGMSNLGIRILYDAVNRVERFSCERVFAPWPDFEQVLRENGLPLYSLETFTPLSRFDVVGFSVGYEMLFTNMLGILDLGGVPLASAGRSEEDPLVIAGGPGVLNPEPIAEFIDVFVMGDGERALVELLERCERSRGAPRPELLEELDGLPYTYVPSRYPARRSGGRMITDIPKRVQRRIEPDLNELPVPMEPIVPLIEVVQERVSVEVNRGCTTGCRYCQAGYTYRPVRERSIPRIMRIVDRNLRATGYDKVSLSSLSVGDFTRLEELVGALQRSFTGRYVSISLPSLRVNSANLDILRRIGSVRRSGLTFAVESADPGQRSLLNKLVDEEGLHRIISHVMAEGWRLIKLYFMIGLPEGKEEAGKIADFLARIRKLHRGLSVNVNVAVFVPKPHTPFQGERQLTPEEAAPALAAVKNAARGARFKVKYQDPRMSCVEGILSRGDRSLGPVVRSVYQRGERFSSWDEMFKYEWWIEEMDRAGVDRDLFMNRRSSPDAGGARPVPWHFVDCGVSGEFFARELARARERTLTENCLHGACSWCGVCDDLVRNRRSSESGLFAPPARRSQEPTTAEGAAPAGEGAAAGTPKVRHKLLFGFQKRGAYRFISHLDLVNLMLKTGRRAELPFAYTEGHNPKPRMSLPFAIP
ncbi:MAG: TIGR03960 family B12-binding radical SAM protein, partial [Spirochaetota bacterium]